MNKDFCVGCEPGTKPTCAIYKIISSTDMDSFLHAEKQKKTDVLVCHCNAQEMKNNYLNIKDNCDECILCQLACSKVSNESKFDEKLEKILFSNLNLLNIYLSEMCKECKIGSEIKSFGNYRQKRIDIVIQKDKTIYLVKVLSDLNKYRFYMDSYNEQIEIYNTTFEDCNFIALQIVKQKEFFIANKKNLNVVTITDLIKTLGE